MANVKNDKTTLELDLRVQKAQEEIHSLNKETAEYKEMQKVLRREIMRLTDAEGDYACSFSSTAL